MVIRYAQTWEDADVLHAALEVESGHTCLAIAAAGDNTLALLARSPHRVIAIDVNPAQLACLALRVAAFRTLDDDELLGFLGVRDCRDRPALYRRCRPLLDLPTRDFWDGVPRSIERGIINCGRFENYLTLFHRFVLPLVHDTATVQRLLQPKTPSERVRFYDTIWDTPFWRMLFRIFFSRRTMSALGRNPRFFDFVQTDVAEHLLVRARHALVDLDPSENPYLRWILTGSYGEVLPFHLRPENTAVIRRNLDRLSWQQISLEAYLEADGPSIDRFALSDVFEYVSAEDYARMLDGIARRGNPRARIAYWNMIVPRSRPESRAAILASDTQAAHRLHERDKAFFYSRFVMETVR